MREVYDILLGGKKTNSNNILMKFLLKVQWLILILYKQYIIYGIALFLVTRTYGS